MSYSKNLIEQIFPQAGPGKPMNRPIYPVTRDNFERYLPFDMVPTDKRLMHSDQPRLPRPADSSPAPKKFSALGMSGSELAILGAASLGAAGLAAVPMAIRRFTKRQRKKEQSNG